VIKFVDVLLDALFLIANCLYIFVLYFNGQFNAEAFKKQNEFLEIWTVILMLVG
jgi:hypothetical protein